MVAILALDTTLLLPGTYGCYATPAAHIWARRRASQQLMWLAQALRTSGAPLKIVVGHYPLYSSGPHGLDSNSNFENQLVSTCASSSRPRIMKSIKCPQLSKTM
jgi:hypothetical protein